MQDTLHPVSTIDLNHSARLGITDGFEETMMANSFIVQYPDDDATAFYCDEEVSWFGAFDFCSDSCNAGGQGVVNRSTQGRFKPIIQASYLFMGSRGCGLTCFDAGAAGMCVMSKGRT